MAVSLIALMILLAVCSGILIIIAILVKQGYGKALAIVFGGTLSLFLLLIVLNYTGTPSFEKQSTTRVKTPYSVEITVAKNPEVEIEMPIDPPAVKSVIAPPVIPSEAKPIELPKETEEVEEIEEAHLPKAKAIDKSLEDWISSKSNEASKTFTAEPYLGTAIDQGGHPAEIVRIDLMNQLTDWLSEEVAGLEIQQTKEKDQVVKSLWNTSQEELWKRFVIDHHVSKHSTSVGDTETLSIRIADADENIAWIRSLVQSRQIEAAYNERLRFYALGGGGTFLGLVTLYGLLSVGSKESKPTSV